MYTIEKIKFAASIAYSTLDTINNTYALSKYCIENNIDGDFVEAGVGAGSQIIVMGAAIQEFKSYKKIYALDSFDGIPLASKFDDSQPGIGPILHNTDVQQDKLLVSSGITVHSLESVKNNILKSKNDLNNYIFYKGWFEKILPDITDNFNNIALLRLDGDLYSSTKVCLEYLYPKVSIGGIIIIDDWALTGCKLACTEYFTKNNIFPEFNYIKNSTPVWFIKK